MHGEDTFHTVNSKDGIGNYSGFVGEPEQLCKVLQWPARLLSTDHC
jgi:hypothetical protein